MAAKHLNQIGHQFSVPNDRQLFIYSYPTSKLSQNIHSMYLVKPNCLCMFFFNCIFTSTKRKWTGIVPDLKISKIHQHGNQHAMHRAHQSHYFYCLKTSRIGSVHSGNIGWVSDQFHNARGSALMGLLDVYTCRISWMQVNWNSYRPRWLCRSLKYREIKSVIKRMVQGWSENTWKIQSVLGEKIKKRKKDAASKKNAGGDDQLVYFFIWPNNQIALVI